MLTRSVLCALSLCAIGPAAAAAVPLGGTLVVLNKAEATASLVDVATGTVVATLPTGASPHEVAVSPDGRLALATNYDTVSVIDSVELKVVAAIPSAGFPIRVAFTPNGRRALVSHARSGDVAVYDTAARLEERRLNAHFSPKPGAANLLGFEGAVPVGIVIDPSGSLAWVAHTNADAVAAFEIASGRLVGKLSAGREPDGMAYSALAAARR